MTDADPASVARPGQGAGPEPEAGGESEDGVEEGSASRRRRRRRRPRPATVASVLAIAVALVPRALTAGRFQTTDEVLWMGRSVGFTDALLAWEPARASASTGELATMPGVTTMWLGTAARGAWALGGVLGLHDGTWSRHGELPIHLSQLAVAVATSLLVGMVMALAWRWAGPVPAVTAGALLATEPFLVAHGAVLHTDELSALCGAVGVLALLLALRRAEAGNGRPWLLAGLAGAGLAGAFLAKLSGLVIGPGVALVVLALLVRAALRARRDGRSVARSLSRPLGVAAAGALAAVATVVASWPAIWADPTTQFDLLLQSAGLAEAGHLQFFRGEITVHPGPWFYAVTTPLRMTPWFLVGAVVLLPLALVSRRWRGRALALVVVAAPAVAVFSASSKQFDRYVLVVLPFLALAVGMGLAVVARAVRARAGRRPTAAVATVVGVALAAHAVAVAPWGLAWFNPLLGGAEVAERNVLIGWGEGLELAGARIAEREDGDCAGLTVATFYSRIRSAFPCGRAVRELEGADYHVLYISERQRTLEGRLRWLRRQGRLVDEVRVAGITYAEIYDLRLPPRPEQRRQ